MRVERAYKGWTCDAGKRRGGSSISACGWLCGGGRDVCDGIIGLDEGGGIGLLLFLGGGGLDNDGGLSLLLLLGHDTGCDCCIDYVEVLMLWRPNVM